MKIFVTVGTTRFDSLVEYIDTNLEVDQYTLTFQISNGRYKPKQFPFFRFTSDIISYYQDCDLVITHAGAGSIYKLLELRKKIIIVPNLDRVDKHQEDIALYMRDNCYGLMTFELNNLVSLIELSRQFEPRYFKKEPFFKVGEIISFLKT